MAAVENHHQKDVFGHFFHGNHIKQTPHKYNPSYTDSLLFSPAVTAVLSKSHFFANHSFWITTSISSLLSCLNTFIHTTSRLTASCIMRFTHVLFIKAHVRTNNRRRSGPVKREMIRFPSNKKGADEASTTPSVPSLKYIRVSA